jgi:hypothetical protein
LVADSISITSGLELLCLQSETGWAYTISNKEIDIVAAILYGASGGLIVDKVGFSQFQLV